ncbi:MAG: hypothetical protein E7016_02270 [Alphaproteobacteria bacterium]|nr:hypothetical protein [Alphaproteobacteria bacterium]
MNKTISLALLSVALLSGCTNLTYHEQQEITRLSYQGISIDRPSGQWEKPASPLLAGVLNILPGVGNFYLASGNAGDSSHWLYGFGNLLLWPMSIVWAVPEAALDANNINKRDMLNYYQYGNGSSYQPTYQPARQQHYNQPQHTYYR